MEDDYVYQIKIKGMDKVTLTVYTNGPNNYEKELLEYMWEKYYHFQPVKSYYKILNLSRDFEEIREFPRILHVHLATKAIEYANTYN